MLYVSPCEYSIANTPSIHIFENVLCENCGHKLAYLQDLKLVASLDPVPAPQGKGQSTEGQPTEALWTTPLHHTEKRTYRLCDNYTKHNVCNWAMPFRQLSKPNIHRETHSPPLRAISGPKQIGTVQ